MKTPRYKQTVCRITRSAFPLLLILASQNAGAQTNTFPSSGNVGVGTTTPDTYANVHVYNAANAGLDIQSSTAAGWSRLRLRTGTRIWGWFAGDSTQPDAPNKIGLFDYTAGAFRMMVDSSGNIGIGTSTPGQKLEVLASDGEALRLYRNASNVGWGVNMKFAFNNSAGTRSDYAGIHALVANGAAGAEAGDLLLTTATNGSLTEKLRVTSAGNVAIGTTNPVFDQNTSRYLALDGGTVGFGSIGAGGTTTNTAYPVGQFAFFNSALGGAERRLATIVGATDGATNNGRIDFWLTSAGSFGTSSKMAILSNGNVGIGASPNYRLDVQGGQINASGGLCIAGDCKSSWSQVGGGGGGSQWTTVSPSNIYYSGGSVGVGTNNPLALLDVRNSDGSFYAGFGYGANKDSFVRAGNSSVGVMHIGDHNTAKTVLQESGGNVGIGTSTPNSQYKLDVAGNINSSGTITGSNIAAKYQDVAEWVPSSEQLASGTVVVLDTTRSNQVISSTQSYDTRVAGVISAQPGITLGEEGEGKVLVATTGRVRVKVDASRGAIQIGDLLVTSDVPGLAMKSEPVEFAGRRMHMPGTIIGKALEPLAKGSGEILVLLSLQ